MKGMQIDEVLTARRSPWQNPFAQRLIGSIRGREMWSVCGVEVGAAAHSGDGKQGATGGDDRDGRRRRSPELPPRLQGDKSPDAFWNDAGDHPHIDAVDDETDKRDREADEVGPKVTGEEMAPG
jgi:hypothetical protein